MNIENTIAGDTAKLIADLSAAGLEPKTIGASVHLLVPPNYSHKEITDLVEKAQPAPSRKRGHVKVKDVASLLAYCADQAQADTAYIYADPDTRTISAIFNDQRAGQAGWRDHRAEFKAEYTSEFTNWLAKNKVQFSQTEFAEFIEDNLADITEPGAHVLLDVATRC